MPRYTYEGQLVNGNRMEGSLEAQNPEHASAMLADMGIRPTRIAAARPRRFAPTLSLHELQLFNDHLTHLTKAELPLPEGLRELAEEVGAGRLATTLRELAAELEQGASLDEALERRAEMFPAQYPALVRAGIATGDLGATLHGLASHMRLKGTFQRAVLQLAVYPAMVLLAAAGVIEFIMRVAMPQVEEMYLEFIGGVSNPWLLQRMQQNAQLEGLIFLVGDYWWVVEIVVGLLLGLSLLALAFLSLPIGRSWREVLLWNLPGFRHIYANSVKARLTQTTAIAAAAGLPLPEMLRLGGTSSGSRRLKVACETVATRLEEGQPLREAADNVLDFPALWRCVVEAGDPRQLGGSLAHLGRTYESQAEHWSRTMQIVLGPVLLFAVATVLAVFLLAIGLLFASVIETLTGG